MVLTCVHTPMHLVGGIHSEPQDWDWKTQVSLDGVFQDFEAFVWPQTIPSLGIARQ
jgi:hypothetical protein